MKEILSKEEYKPLKEGDIVEGTVIGKSHLVLYLDVGKKTGIVFGKEFLAVKDEIKQLKIGDKVLAKIINLDNEDGFVELSLKEAEKEALIKDFEKIKERGETLKVKILKANKGGFLTKISGISAFLPISQISNEIQNQKELVGKEIEVKILSVSKNGLILSQKLAKEKKELKIGEIVEGEVSGITHYGVFLKFGDEEGLIKKEEIKEKNLKIGEKLKAKIAEVSENKIFLSLK